MKVGARKLRGKATTKKATKKVTKKAAAIAKVKVLKHKKVTLEPMGTDSLPELVFVSAGPQWAKELVGKRYVNLSFATMAIDTLDAERNIAKGAKYVAKELVQAGTLPLDTTETETEE